LASQIEENPDEVVPPCSNTYVVGSDGQRSAIEERPWSCISGKFFF